MENPIKKDDLVVSLFLETPKLFISSSRVYNLEYFGTLLPFLCNIVFRKSQKCIFPHSKTKKIICRWFKVTFSYFSSPIVGGHQQPLRKGHVNSPSQKGHFDWITRSIIPMLAGKIPLIYDLYIAYWAIIYHLPPSKETRNSYWQNKKIIHHIYIYIWGAIFHSLQQNGRGSDLWALARRLKVPSEATFFDSEKKREGPNPRRFSNKNPIKYKNWYSSWWFLRMAGFSWKKSHGGQGKYPIKSTFQGWNILVQ